MAEKLKNPDREKILWLYPEESPIYFWIEEHVGGRYIRVSHSWIEDNL